MREAEQEPALREVKYQLTFVGTEVAHVGTWMCEVTALDEPAVNPLPYDATVPSFEPLLSSVLARAVLSEAASTRTSDGPVDIDRLMHNMAARLPIRIIPRLPVLTLYRGAQILVDRSASMQPFQADADDLAMRLKRVAPQGATQLLYFDEDPSVVDDTRHSCRCIDSQSASRARLRCQNGSASYREGHHLRFQAFDLWLPHQRARHRSLVRNCR
jgi:hypothetical protein